MVKRVVVISALSLFAVACGGDDGGGDPIPAACNAACALKVGVSECTSCAEGFSCADAASGKECDRTLCVSFQPQCDQDCKSLGTQAWAQGFKPRECALCLIGLLEYSPAPDGSKCYGLDTQAATQLDHPECKDVCINPEG